MARLALAGGTPVRSRPFPSWPQFGEEEKQRLEEVLQSGNWGGYPFPNRFARELAQRFASYHSAPFGVCVANGTLALEVALKGVGVGPGDEVIVPAYTFEATAGAVLRLGAVPVFADVSERDYCLEVAAAEAAVTSRTRALLPVHLAMNVADLDALRQLAQKHELRLVEDCAHAHGARWRDRGVGSWGDAGAFSMQSSKLMTAGEGGMVVTRHQEVFEICQSYTNCGRASEDRFVHRLVGFNFRMTEFQAALLLEQLRRLPEQTRLRQERAARLRQGLASLAGIGLLESDPRLTQPAIYQFVFKYQAEAFGNAHRDRFVAALNAEGIPCDGRFYEPLYRSDLFPATSADYPQLAGEESGGRCWAGLCCPVAERAADQEAVWLPHPVLLGSPEDVDSVVEAIRKIQENIDELLRAEHPWIDWFQTSRAVRDRHSTGVTD